MITELHLSLKYEQWASLIGCIDVYRLGKTNSTFFNVQWWTALNPKIHSSSSPNLRFLQNAEFLSRLHPAILTMCSYQLMLAWLMLDPLLLFPPVQRNVAQTLGRGCWCLDPTSNKAAQVPQDKKTSSQISSLPTWEAKPHGLMWLRGICYTQAMCLLTSTKVLNMEPYQAAHHRLAAFLWCELQGQG